MRNRMRLAIPAITLLLTLPLTRAGAEKPATSGGYRDNGDGTVTDLKTKQIWQRCSVGQNNDAKCSGKAQAMDWDAAVKACKDLKLAGKKWDLPTKDELKGLVHCSDGTPTPLKDYGNGSPDRCGWSGGKNYEKEYTRPTINAGSFPGTVAKDYWSSSILVLGAPLAWIVNFNDGSVVNGGMPDNYYVRCVSGGEERDAAEKAEADRSRSVQAVQQMLKKQRRDAAEKTEADRLATERSYRDNGNGTVTDLKTKLIWQRCSVGQNSDAGCSGMLRAMNWDAAVQTCADLKLAGKSWRLPEKG